MPQRATTPNLPGIPTVPRIGGGGAAGPFSPDQIAGLQAWYQESGLQILVGEVVGWNDSSGNAKHLTPLDALPPVATNFLNGFDVVNFTTGDGSTGNPLNRGVALMAGTASTMFLVGYKDSAWGESGFYTTRASAQANHHPFSDNNVYDANFSSARKSCGAQIVTIPDNWRILSFRSQDNDYRMEIDGVTQHTTATNTFALGSDFILGVGGYDGTNQTYALQGYIAEVIVYNVFLSDGQRDQVIGYLQDRFNL